MALTTDPTDEGLHQTRPDGQQENYLILSYEERAKGFVRPVRTSYIHLACGSITRMPEAIAETYARDPQFYGATYCCHCRNHYPLVNSDGERQFKWFHQGREDGSFVGE